MENATKIGLSALVLMGVLSGAFVLQEDDNLYFCEDRMITYSCDTLSAYYGLDNGKCWNPDGNKLCRSGWVEVFNDVVDEDDYVSDEIVEDESEFVYVSKHNSKQIKCDQEKCYEV